MRGLLTGLTALTLLSSADAQSDLWIDAQRSVEIIARDAGLPAHYRVIASTDERVGVAAAAIINGERAILFDPRAIEQLETKTGSPWAFRMVIAHEVAHHLAGQTIDGTHHRHQEIECDLYAGGAIYRMGGRLADATSFFADHADIPLSETHPAGRERILYTALGWQLAACRDDPARCHPDEARP